MTATDPEGRTVSYRLAGGDTDRFTIDPGSGHLQTRTGATYNFEAQDRYVVTVEAEDEQGGRATIVVTIEVTDDDNERPGQPDPPSVTESTLTSLTVRWTAPSNTGPAITDYNVQYREGTSGPFTSVTHDGPGRTTTISNLQSNTAYQIQVQATSDEGTSLWSDAGNGRTVANQAPTFNEGSTTTRRFAENTTGTRDISNPVSATDSDGGTLSYSLEGEDRASFALDGDQLQTRAGETYDYEEKDRYEVVVRVEDGQGGSNTIEVTVALNDEQEPPEDPAAPGVQAASSTSLTVSWDEPANTGPDIDRYNVQYREGDSGAFTSWSHNSADRTTTITDLTPDTIYQAQVQAHNAEGASSWSPSGTGITNPNQLPVFTDRLSATRSLAENTEGVENIGDPVGATDPENTTLTYSLEGQDADAFTLDSRSGQLRTSRDETYDYETKPRYVLSVKATDRHGGERTIPVFIDLNDINEAPTFTSDATFEAAENNQYVGQVSAEDVDSGDGIAGYTITGGADRDRFEINSGGVLTFKDDPDFENPTNTGRNNNYVVEVTATGGTGGRALTAEQTITVTVTDENEPPGAPGRPRVEAASSTSLTVTWDEPTNTGPDVDDYDVQYREGTVGGFTPWPHDGTNRTVTITDLTAARSHQAQVRAHNDEGWGDWSASGTGSTGANRAPAFNEDSSTTRSMAENTTGVQDIGDPIRATDPENTALTYGLEGQDADAFTINANNGQLRTRSGVTYDYETKASFSVTVSVRDSRDGDGNPDTEADDTIDVTITLTNEDEDGTVSFFPDQPRVGTVLRATISDPDGDVRSVSWQWHRSTDQTNWTSVSASGASYTPKSSDAGMYIRARASYRDREGSGKTAEAVSDQTVGAREAAPEITVVELVSGLTIPWDLAFTHDGTMLFTKRGGVLSSRLTDGTVQTVTADFSDLYVSREAGLMAIVVDPDFSSNRRFYTCQSHTGRTAQVIAWTINARYASATRVADPLVGDIPAAGRHSGCRLRIGPQGYLWIATGDATSGTVPQDLTSLGGKVLRVNASTGAAAPGNPFGTRVYTYGHRNPQGLARRPGTNQMWSVEHGPTVDDEINLLSSGGNYGWDPVPGYNESVPMTDLGKFSDAVEARWSSGDRTLATSGGIFLEGADWEEWNGRLAVATLKGRSLRVFEFAEDGTFVSQVVVPELDGTYSRLRTPMLGPDGALYVTTSNGAGADRILRVTASRAPAFLTDTQIQHVEENSSTSDIVAKVLALDPKGETLTYTLSGPDAPSFNIADATVGDLRANVALDYETRSSYEIIVTATNPGGLSDSVTLTINVTDVNEPPGKPDPPTVSNETENSLTVTWDEPTNTGPDITNYFVQYRENGAFTDWPDSGLTRTRTITGLRSGRTYQVQVQAKNPEGKGPWSDRANGTTLTAPTVSSVAFTSSPASGQNGAYKRDDVMDVTATFNDTVAVIGMPQIDLTVGSTVRQADYQSGSTTPQLLFQYTVQATDEDKDGATINANGLKLNGGRIRKNNTAINADLAHAARTNRSGHRVDGIAPALTEAEVKSDELALSYGEVLDGDPRPATGDFAVAVDDTAHSVTAVTMYTSEVSLTLASAVTPGQTVRLAYTPGTNPIRDRARNPAIALTNLIVANRTQDPALNVCSRTTQVRDAIVAASPVSTCGAVTADHLSAITRLPLIFKNISTLKADDFSGLTNLEILSIGFNQLTSLPANIFSDLSALKSLSLHGNDLSSLNANIFSNLTALDTLSIGSNQFTSLPANIFSDLSALEVLGLSSNDLSSLDANIFSNLSALEELWLSGNDLSSLDANIFSNLSALKNLSLSSNDLSSLDANIFSNLSALETLFLSSNDLSSLDANIFSNLSALEELWLSGNDLSSLDANIFSNLSALETLRLDRNDLSSLPANIFSNLSALETLRLDRNDLSSLDANIFSNLSALTTLYLEENDLSTVAASAFSGLTALKTLWLHENDLQSTSLPMGVFSSLTALETLELSDNQLSSLPANLFSGLSSLQELYLNGQQTSHELSSLDAGLFSGLTNLETLHLNDNSLSSLPDGIFSGLTALKTLKLEGNTVDPLPITVSLELVASGQLKAKVHTGAPFEMALPLNVVNGTIDGGTGSIEISQGSQESNVLTVSRTTGTAAAVTVDIGTFPDLPGTDSGYALVKSADLPLEVIAGLPEVKIYPTALSVAVSDSNTYTMALNSRPTMDVTVKVNVPTGSDVSVNPMERMFAAETYDMSQTVTVIADSDAVANDMVMLSHMVSGGDYQDVLADTVSVTIIGATSTNQSPTFTSASTFDVKENETEVGTVVATDVDARDYITGYEITGGAHQAQFSITSGGILTFVTAPDYEHPVASNNVYGVQVTASSGTGTRERTATQTITVVIDDVDEPPGQPPAPIISISSTRSSLLVSSGRTPLTNTGPDITAYEIQYRVKDTGDFKSTSLTLVPDRDWPVLIEELNRNQTYEVQVRAKNDEGESEWSPSAEATIPNASPIASSIDDVTLPAGGIVERVNVDDVFDDPDDSRLRYTALSSNSAAATVQTIDGVVLITPVATGTATITVMATDPWSATTSTTFDAIIQSPTLQTPTLSISGNLFTFGFTDNFAANETRAYQIRIRQKTPIGQWATGCFTATNDDNSPITLEDLISDFFEPGTTYEADYGYLGTDCGDSVIGVRSATAEATTDGTPSFDIDLVFVGSISSKYRTACETAARRWEQIITHDIPKHSLSSRWRNLLDTLYPGTTAPEVVDDLVIYVEIEEIDGEGGTLGQAGPDVWRVPSSLPIAAGLELDEDDLGTMSNQRLAAVILHEIGHTLGYGLGQWDDHNLLKNPSLDVYNNRIVPAPDTHFSGANAIAAFNDAGGSSYSGAKVPVENTRGGSEDSHWRESVLDNELMTPSLASTGPYPLSAITIQSLADIGYRVDVTQADAYTLPSSSSSSTRTARASGKDGGDLILLNCIVTHPEAGPDEPEPIILNLRSTPEGE